MRCRSSARLCELNPRRSRGCSFVEHPMLSSRLTAMSLTPVELLQYGGGIALEAGVCVLALRRGVYGRFRLFTIYLCALIPCDIIRWIPILTLGLASPAALWTYWITQSFLMLLRAAVVVEICYYLLGPYPGVWRLCRAVLTFVAMLIVSTAILTTESRGPWITRVLLTVERGMELAILGTVLFALVFCRYYRIRVDFVDATLTLGLGLYSAIQVANNTFLNHWLARYLPYWGEVRVQGFNIVLVVWLVALWRPLPAPDTAPALLAREDYAELTSQVSFRLRQLNARLEDMLK